MSPQYKFKFRLTKRKGNQYVHDVSFAACSLPSTNMWKSRAPSIETRTSFWVIVIASRDCLYEIPI